MSSMLQTKLVENKKTSADHFNAIMVNHDLNSLLSKRDSVTRNLDQLKFEAEQDNFRVILPDSAVGSQNCVEQQTRSNTWRLRPWRSCS